MSCVITSYSIHYTKLYETPGEDVIIQFVIMDLSDGILDSTVILDNFVWDCEGGPPVTVPG